MFANIISGYNEKNEKRYIFQEVSANGQHYIFFKKDRYEKPSIGKIRPTQLEEEIITEEAVFCISLGNFSKKGLMISYGTKEAIFKQKEISVEDLAIFFLKKEGFHTTTISLDLDPEKASDPEELFTFSEVTGTVIAPEGKIVFKLKEMETY